MKKHKLLLLIFLTGCIVRGLFLYQSLLCIPASTDEAIVGLMSKQILRGKFPLFFLGQPYLGPLDSYLGTILTLIFGAGVFSVRLYHVVLSVLFMLLTYAIVRDVYGKDAGFLSLILTAVPSSYFMTMSSYTQAPYMSLLVMGLVIFYISERVVRGDRGSIYFLLFGFLSGICIWMHFLSITYIAPSILFIFLKKPKIFLKNLWITALSFITGIFPLGLAKSTTSVIERTDFNRAFINLKSFFSDTLPGVLGIRAVPFIDTDCPILLPGILTVPAAVVYLISFVIFVFLCIRGVFKKGIAQGFDCLLLVFFVFVVLLFCFGKRSGAHEYRYILLLYLVFPIITARLITVSRGFANLAVTVILLFNLCSNAAVIKVWNMPLFAREYGNLPRTEELIDFLKSKNIHHAYSSYWLSYRLTLETDEEIISSQPYNERFQKAPLPYLEQVDSADRVAFVFTERFGVSPSLFSENLIVLGGGYKKEIIGDFNVFYDFSEPRVYSKPIPSTDWVVSSNFGADKLSFAIDRDIKTRWGSGHPQEEGMYFKIDLGDIYSVNKIYMDVGRFVTDGPRGYRIEESSDDVNWKTVVNMPHNIGHMVWRAGHPKLLLDGGVEVIFEPKPLRFIRITETGHDPRFDWSVAEVYVWGYKSG